VAYIRSPIARATVSVVHGGSNAPVRLAALRFVRDGGRRLVSLADVWWAAGLPVDPTNLRVDLVGDDGFDTSVKRGEPLTGAALDHGLVDVETRDVSWGVDVPCYYRVKGMLAMRARAWSPALAK
jgi:hypothetical protein